MFGLNKEEPAKEEKKFYYVAEQRFYLKNGNTLHARFKKTKTRSESEDENNRIRGIVSRTMTHNQPPTFIDIRGDLVLSTAINAVTFHVFEYPEKNDDE